MDSKTLYLMQPNEALKNMHRSLETRKQRNNNAGKQNQNDVTRNRLSQTFIGAVIIARSLAKCLVSHNKEMVYKKAKVACFLFFLHRID